MQLYKKELYFLFTCPSVFAGLIFFAVAPAFYFFVVGNFFDGDIVNLINFFEFLPFCAAFFVPAITMNAWSAEFTQGKLNGFGEFMFSRPFLVRKIFAAKWLAAFTIFIGGIILIIPTIMVASTFVHIDPGICFASFVLLLFFFAAAASLGIFLAFHVKNAVFAFGLYAIMLILGAILPSFCQNSHSLREYASILSYFSFSGHFRSASLGIFDSRDLIFYGIVAAFFFVACFLKEKSTFALFTLLSILVLINSRFYPMSGDISENKIFSLSKTTEKIFENSKNRVEITYFRSDKLKNHYPQAGLVEVFLEKYADLGAVVKILDPQKENLVSHLADVGIFPQQLQSSSRGEVTFSDVFAGILIENQGLYSAIPFVVSTENLEFEIANRLLSVSAGKKPQIQVVVANGLTLSDAYIIGMQFLAVEEFEILEFSPGKLETLDEKIPLLLFGGDELSENDVVAISRFCDNGGNAVFCVGASHVDLDSDWACKVGRGGKKSLLRLFESWGVQITEDLVLDVSCANLILEETPGDSATPGRMEHFNYPFWVQTIPKTREQKSFCALWPNEILVFPDENRKIQPLFTSSRASWLQHPLEDGTYKTDPFSTYSGENNPKTVGSHVIACILQENSAKRIFFADEHSFSQMTHYSATYENFETLLDSVLIVSQREELLPLRNSPKITSPVFEEEDFEAKKLSAYGIVFLLIPLLITSTFVAFIGMRKKRKIHV